MPSECTTYLCALPSSIVDAGASLFQTSSLTPSLTYARPVTPLERWYSSPGLKFPIARCLLNITWFICLGFHNSLCSVQQRRERILLTKKILYECTILADRVQKMLFTFKSGNIFWRPCILCDRFAFTTKSIFLYLIHISSIYLYIWFIFSSI